MRLDVCMQGNQAHAASFAAQLRREGPPSELLPVMGDVAAAQAQAEAVWPAQEEEAQERTQRGVRSGAPPQRRLGRHLLRRRACRTHTWGGDEGRGEGGIQDRLVSPDPRRQCSLPEVRTWLLAALASCRCWCPGVLGGSCRSDANVAVIRLPVQFKRFGARCSRARRSCRRYRRRFACCRCRRSVAAAAAAAAQAGYEHSSALLWHRRQLLQQPFAAAPAGPPPAHRCKRCRPCRVASRRGRRTAAARLRLGG